MNLKQIKEQAGKEFDKKFNHFAGLTYLDATEDVKDFINKYIDLTAKEMERETKVKKMTIEDAKNFWHELGDNFSVFNDFKEFFNQAVSEQSQKIKEFYENK